MRFNHSVVQSVAKKHGKDEAQIMLRWGLQHVRQPRPACITTRSLPHQTTRPSMAARHRVTDFANIAAQGFVIIPKSVSPKRIKSNARSSTLRSLPRT